MDKAALFGGALYTSKTPNDAAKLLARTISGESVSESELTANGLEPRLVEVLRGAVSANPDDIKLACEKGAAWVLGRRSAQRSDSWALVASLGTAKTPAGLRHGTAETFISLIMGASSRVRFIAPYVDSAGVAVLSDAITAALQRGVVIEVFEPKDWPPSKVAINELRRVAKDADLAHRLHTVDVASEGPWPHLKVLVADGDAAYIGSANITAAALAGRNLELGVIVRGEQVQVIDQILDLCRLTGESE